MPSVFVAKPIGNVVGELGGKKNSAAVLWKADFQGRPKRNDGTVAKWSEKTYVKQQERDPRHR